MRCSPRPRRSRASWARSPPCSPCTPGTRRPWRPPWVRPRTRSPSPTPTPPSSAIAHLKAADLGRAGMLLGRRAGRRRAAGRRCRPGRRTRSTWWTARTDLRRALRRLLHKAAVVDDLDAARALVAELPDVTAVTRAGDLLGATSPPAAPRASPACSRCRRPSTRRPALSRPPRPAERLGFEPPVSTRSASRRSQRVDVALAKLHESDATLAAVAEELGQYGSQVRSARGEAERLERAIATAEAGA